MKSLLKEPNMGKKLEVQLIAHSQLQHFLRLNQCSAAAIQKLPKEPN